MLVTTRTLPWYARGLRADLREAIADVVACEAALAADAPGLYDEDGVLDTEEHYYRDRQCDDAYERLDEVLSALPGGEDPVGPQGRGTWGHDDTLDIPDDTPSLQDHPMWSHMNPGPDGY
jgi:hypothetical protein